MTASRARRMSLITSGIAILMLGALGGTGAAADRQGPVTVTFEFTASSFGGSGNRMGSTPGAPLRRVTGTFTVTYTPADLAGARLNASAMRGGQQGARASTWAKALAAQNMRVQLARPSGQAGQQRAMLRLDGAACGTKICGGTNDFSMAFEFDTSRPGAAQPTFRWASYAVTGVRDVYRARIGTVTVKRT